MTVISGKTFKGDTGSFKELSIDFTSGCVLKMWKWYTP